MLTQCPNCQTIFRVTSEILRVADGQVRCGRCQRQFDALERLIEEHEDELEAHRRVTQEPTPSRNIEVEEPPTHEDITMEGRHIEISGTYRVADRFGNGEALEEQTTEEWVEIEEESVEDDASTPDEDHDLEELPAEGGEVEEIVMSEEPAPDSEIAEPSPEESEDDFNTAQTIPVRTTGSPRFAYGKARHPIDEPDVDLLAPPVRRETHSKVWGFLVAPLVLLLIAQWVHSHRHTLARHPTIGEPLRSAYQSLGIPLTPSWDLHAYQIRQWGVMSDPTAPGTLRVRATITNLADFAQPYPLLKLMLEDRWGEQISAREFDPSEYLDPTIAPNRMLDSGQQANATIAIIDPGPDAEGFRFDVCLRGTNATVCAEEVRRR